MDQTNGLVAASSESNLPVFVSAAPKIETVEIDKAQRSALRDLHASKSLVSLHESGHLACTVLISAEIAAGIRQGTPVKAKAVDVEAATTVGGYTRTDASEKNRYPTKADLYNEIVIALGGRAAELAWGHASTGSEHDLRRSTRKASDICDSALDLSDEDTLPADMDSMGSRATESMKAAYCARVEAILADAYADARRIVNMHKPEILALAERIYTAGRLSDERLRAAIRESGLPLEDDGIEGN